MLLFQATLTNEHGIIARLRWLRPQSRTSIIQHVKGALDPETSKVFAVTGAATVIAPSRHAHAQRLEVCQLSPH